MKLEPFTPTSLRTESVRRRLPIAEGFVPGRNALPEQRILRGSRSQRFRLHISGLRNDPLSVSAQLEPSKAFRTV